MGTRGYRIIKFKGRYWIFYNHWDSYPNGLGQWLVDSIPADPGQYQKWLQSQRDFFAEWDSLLDEILTIQPEYMRKLLLNEPQKAVFFSAFDDRLMDNAPPSYASAGHDGYIEWTYTIDLDREVFSVGDGAHFTLNKVPSLWYKALFEDRESNKFLLPQLVPAESVATSVLDPPSFSNPARYQNLQSRIVKPRRADEPTSSHPTGNKFRWMLFNINQKSWQRDLSIGLLGWQAQDLPFRELAFFILCLASGGDHLALLDERCTKMPYPGASYLGITTEGSSEPEMELATYLGVGYHMAGLPTGSAPEESKYWFEGALICLVPRLNCPGILQAAIADAVEYGRTQCTTNSFNAVLISIEHLVLIKSFPDGTVDHTEVLPLIHITSHLSQDPRARYGERVLEAFYAVYCSVKKRKVKEPESESDRDHIDDYEDNPTDSDEECNLRIKRVASMPVKDVSTKSTFMALVQFFETIALETLPPARPNELDCPTKSARWFCTTKFRLICQRRTLVMDNLVFQNILPKDQASFSIQEKKDKKVKSVPQGPPDFLAVELSSDQQMNVWLERWNSSPNALTCLVVAGNEWNRKTFVTQSISFQGLRSPLASSYETSKRTPTPNRNLETYGSKGTNWEMPILKSRINIESNTKEIGQLWVQTLLRFDVSMKEPAPGWTLPPNTIHYFGTALGFDEDDGRPSEKLFFHYLYLRVKRLGKFCNSQWGDIIREATEQLNQTEAEDLKPYPHGGVIGGEEPFVILVVGLEARLFQWKQGFDETVDEKARRKRSPSSALRELNPGTVLNVCEKSDREEIERFLKRVTVHKDAIQALKSATYEGKLEWYE